MERRGTVVEIHHAVPSPRGSVPPLCSLIDGSPLSAGQWTDYPRPRRTHAQLPMVCVCVCMCLFPCACLSASICVCVCVAIDGVCDFHPSFTLTSGTFCYHDVWLNYLKVCSGCWKCHLLILDCWEMEQPSHDYFKVFSI